MAQKNPIADALLNLYEVHADRRQAELDLDRARTREAMLGRSVVPGVFAELQEQKLKEQKRREQVAKAGQAQQAPSSSMLPPLTDVSGQTTGRDPTTALKAVGELFDVVSGGGGLKRAGQQPGMPGATLPQPGIGPGINPAAGPPAAQAQQIGAPGQVQAPPQATPSVGPTGAQNITPPMSSEENLGRKLGRVGLNVLGGRLGVNLGSEFLPEPPTDEQIAEYNAAQARTLAPGIAALERRRRDSNPAISGPAQQLYDQKLSEIEQINPGIAAEARRQGFDHYLAQDEEIRIRQEDPKYKVQRARAEESWRIEQKVIAGGVESLTAGERDFHEGKKPGVNATVNLIQPTPAEKSRLQGMLEQGRTAIQHLDSIDAALGGADWAFTAEGKAETGMLRLQAKSPLLFGNLTEAQQKKIAQFTRIEQAVAAFNVPEMHTLFGAALTPAELERAMDLFPSMSKDWVTNRTDLEQLREDYALSLFRRELVLEKNQAIDPRFAMSLGNTKQAAVDAVMERTDQHIKAGLDPAQARQRTEFEFKGRYGLDVRHLLGIVKPGSQSRQ